MTSEAKKDQEPPGLPSPLSGSRQNMLLNGAYVSCDWSGAQQDGGRGGEQGHSSITQETRVPAAEQQHLRAETEAAAE